MHLHGIGLDANDDKGCPPYPLLKDLPDTDLDYITGWLDHYALNRDDSPRYSIYIRTESSYTPPRMS